MDGGRNEKRFNTATVVVRGDSASRWVEVGT